MVTNDSSLLRMPRNATQEQYEAVSRASRDRYDAEQVRREAERRAEAERMLPKEQAWHREAWLSDCGIPAKFGNSTFDNFDIERQPKAYTRALAYDGRHSLVLLSPGIYGVGKTHLVCAVADRVLRQAEAAHINNRGQIVLEPCPVVFTTETILLARIRATFNQPHDNGKRTGETEESIYEEVEAAQHLFVDDVGKVTPRDKSFLQSVWFRIINSRYEDNLPIVMTANLNGAQLEAHLGGAVADRLLEMAGDGNIVIMRGESYRKLKAVGKAVPDDN